MTRAYIKIFICIYFLISFSLNSQILRESDPQIIESIQNIQGQESKIMKIKVYYQYRIGDYIAFYDFKGDSLLLKYRIDRWDHSKDYLFKNLRQGLLYEVEFEFQEMVSEIPKKISLGEAVSIRSFILQQKARQKKERPSTKKDLRREKYSYVGRFIQLRIAYLDRLIY